MNRIRALLPLLLLAACAAPGPTPAPEIAARLPERVADQQRQAGGDPAPGFVVRYASPIGNRTTLFLTPDPALAQVPDSATEDRLEPHLRRANRILGADLLRRREVPGLARVRVRAREPGREAICLLAPVAEPPSLEALCLAVLSGQLATARITVGGIRGTGRDRTIYAGHMAIFFFDHLRRAGIYGGVASAAAAGRDAAGDDAAPLFPERSETADPVPAAPMPPGR